MTIPQQLIRQAMGLLAKFSETGEWEYFAEAKDILRDLYQQIDQLADQEKNHE